MTTAKKAQRQENRKHQKLRNTLLWRSPSPEYNTMLFVPWKSSTGYLECTRIVISVFASSPDTPSTVFILPSRFKILRTENFLELPKTPDFAFLLRVTWKISSLTRVTKDTDTLTHQYSYLLQRKLCFQSWERGLKVQREVEKKNAYTRWIIKILRNASKTTIQKYML